MKILLRGTNPDNQQCRFNSDTDSCPPEQISMFNDDGTVNDFSNGDSSNGD